jgi:hypothetical protein
MARRAIKACFWRTLLEIVTDFRRTLFETERTIVETGARSYIPASASVTRNMRGSMVAHAAADQQGQIATMATAMGFMFATKAARG